MAYSTVVVKNNRIRVDMELYNDQAIYQKRPQRK